MKDLIKKLNEWQASNTAVAVATVISTWGSAPRQAGAKMLINATGEHIGSISGGCVEGAVIGYALEVIQSQKPQLVGFGVSDADAQEVGLACGGRIEIFIEPAQAAHLAAWRTRPAYTESYVYLTRLTGTQQIGFLGIVKKEHGSWIYTQTTQTQVPPLTELEPSLETVLKKQAPQTIQHPTHQGSEHYWIEPVLPTARLIIVGGVHIAQSLVRIAQVLHYQTIIIEPRRAFAGPARFPECDQIIHAWPDKAYSQAEITPQTAIAILTHDPKIDDLAIKLALESPAFYVGALGSARTQAARKERLAAAGLEASLLNKLKGPIGLNLGGRQPEEIALAIMAEITQIRYHVAPHANHDE